MLPKSRSFVTLHFRDFDGTLTGWQATGGPSWHDEPKTLSATYAGGPLTARYYKALVNSWRSSSMVSAMGLPLVLLALEAFSTRVGTSRS